MNERNKNGGICSTLHGCSKYSKTYVQNYVLKDYICATKLKEDEKVHQISQDLYSLVTLTGIWQITNWNS